MIASCDERRACRRAKSRGMELCVAQPRIGDAVHGRCRDDTAERATYAVALVVGHNEQNVWRALGRHDARRPLRRGLRRGFVDHPAELRWRRRELLPVNARLGAGRTQLARDLLCSERRSGRRDSKEESRDCRDDADL